MELLFVQAYDLSVDECSFTGENEPALKRTDSMANIKKNDIADRHNVAFMGTLVRCGNGKVITSFLLHVFYFLTNIRCRINNNQTNNFYRGS